VKITVLNFNSVESNFFLFWALNQNQTLEGSNFSIQVAFSFRNIENLIKEFLFENYPSTTLNRGNTGKMELEPSTETP
jgi:hypothetical protein